MKEPKTFKYPRLYWRNAGTDWDTRIRIVYPNGTAVWGDGQAMETHGCWNPGVPCWNFYAPKSNTGKDTVERMKKFDSRHGFETIYLGEIK